MHLVDAPILFRTHMHTHWLWVRLERFSVATTSGHRLFPPLFFFPYRIPLLSSREYFTLQVNHVTRSRRRRQRTRHSSAEKYTRRRKAALAHTDTHTHTPSQTSRLEDKVLRLALLAEKPNARPDSFFFCFFFLPIRIRTLMFLSVAHADALNSLAHRAAVPAPLGSETRAPSL